MFSPVHFFKFEQIKFPTQIKATQNTIQNMFLLDASAISSIQFGFGYASVILSAICLGIILLMNIDKDIDQIQKDLMAKHSA